MGKTTNFVVNVMALHKTERERNNIKTIFEKDKKEENKVENIHDKT